MSFGSDTWMISAIMRFSGNGASFFNQLGAAAGGAEKKVDRVTMAMNRLRGATTMISGAFVAAMAAIDIFAVKSAASLQRTLIAIRNETGADPRKMGKFYNSAFSISNIMGVAPEEGARVLLDISRLTAGQLSTAQMQAIAPRIAGFASTVNFNRPDISVEDATKAGLQLIHLFRAYHPSQMNPLFDQVYRLSGLMSEGLPQAVRQMTYYEPLFKGLKIDTGTSVAMMALLDRSGFRNKSGTTVNAAMLEALGPLQLTKHAQAGKLGLLEQMGVFRGGQFGWNNPDGGVNFLGMLNSVAHWANALERSGVARSSVQKTIASVFGRQGGRIMSLMADPQMIGILDDILKYQRNPYVSLAVGERNRQDSLSFQAGRAWGNFQAVVTELAFRQLPALTAAFRSIADAAHNAQQWLHGHRRAEGTIAGGLGLLTGIAALRFGGGLLYKGLDIMGGFAGMKGAEGATISLGSKMLMVFDNIFTAGFAARLMPVFGRFFTWIFRLLPGAVDFLPGINLAFAAVEAVMVLPKLIAHLPTIGVAIANWWNRSQGTIGATIGWAFGYIARMMVEAIKKLAAVVGSAVKTFSENAFLLFTLRGNMQLANMIAQNAKLAGTQWDRTHRTSFSDAASYGMSAGYALQSLPQALHELANRPGNVDVHQSFQVTIPAGTTADQARAFLGAAMAGIRSAVRSRGNILTNPREPRFHSLDLASPSLGLY